MSNKTWHSHIAKGSMHDAHNLDERSERASLGNKNHEPKPVTPVNISASKIEQTRLALRKRDELQNRTTKD